MRILNVRSSVLKSRLMATLAATALTMACSTAGPPDVIPPSDLVTQSQLPFNVSLKPIPVTGWSGGHSFAVAEVDDLVILVGGRTNGMHHFPLQQNVPDDQQAFPRVTANDHIILLDPANGKMIASKSIADLPSPINLHLKSTNPLYGTEDGWLYYVGGYGEDPDNPTLITMPYVTAIQLDALVAALKDPSAKLDEAFRNKYIAFTDNFAAGKVTGGEMRPVFTTEGKRVEKTFFMVFGHVFDGMYFANGAQAMQQYRNRVQNVSLSVTQSGDGTTSPAWTVKAQDLGSNPSPVQYAENLPPDNPYHRRDLTVAASFRPGGGMAVTAYGGVFKNDLGGYLEPIYVQSYGYGQTSVELDISAKQLLSHYKCPVIQMFDADSETMYSTFLAGISYYYWDPETRKLKRDPVELPRDGLPFIDSVSTLVASAGDGKTKTAQYLIEDLTFPPAEDVFDCQGDPVEYLGAETHLIPAHNDLPRFANGVIDYATWKKSGKDSYVIGYALGGIASTQPYSAKGSASGGKTCPSNRIYEVTVTLKPQDVTLLTAPAE